MKQAFLYCDKRSLNEATVYYVSLVNDCLKERGYSVQTVFSLKDIVSPDLIFTVSNYYFVKAKIKFPRTKTLNWKQGAAFEEAKMIRPFYKWIPFYFCEFCAVHFSNMQFFVSEKMGEYYSSKFFYRGHNHIIMPCFNLQIGNFINVDRYKAPTFVYAGGISKWQSIDAILDTYSRIECKIPSSSLTMYARDKNYILQEANTRGIKHIEVKYVPLEQLQDELQGYKYGFLLREKNWVNYVATPTKMNSYLAAFLIPIFSDGVNDFERHIDLGEFTLMAKTPLNPDEIANTVVNFENSIHDYDKYKNRVQDVFKSHYNELEYKKQIISKMEECRI